MPTPTTLAVFAFAALALIAIPGPNMAYIAVRSLAEGRRAGLASALGVQAGTLVHIAAAAVGLSALVASSATTFTALKYAGAAYLIFLGLRMLLRGEPDHDTVAAVPAALSRVFAEGVLVNVLNPKVGLFFLAFLPQFVDPERGAAAAQILVLGVVFFAIALTVDVLFALGAGSLGAWLGQRPRARRRQRRIAGSVYVLLGVAAALAPSSRARSMS